MFTAESADQMDRRKENTSDLVRRPVPCADASLSPHMQTDSHFLVCDLFVLKSFNYIA